MMPEKHVNKEEDKRGNTSLDITNPETITSLNVISLVSDSD
jgi:hypothetical protein